MIDSTDLATRSTTDLETRPSEPITVSTHVWAGPGIGRAEIQVRIEPPVKLGKGKILTVGVPRSEIEQILAVLKISAFMGVYDYDVQCRLIGTEKFVPHYGLALCIVICGSYFRRPVARRSIYIGEIDLNRQIRGGSARLIESLRVGIDAGDVERDAALVLPSSLNAQRLVDLGARIVPCSTLAEVFSAAWPTPSETVEKS